MNVLGKMIRIITGKGTPKVESKEEEIRRLQEKRVRLEETMRRDLSYLDWDGPNIRREK